MSVLAFRICRQKSSHETFASYNVHVMLFIGVYLIAAYKYRWLDRSTPWITAFADKLTYPQMFDLHNLGPAAYCGIFPITLATLSSLYDQCQRKTADPTVNDQTSSLGKCLFINIDDIVLPYRIHLYRTIIIAFIFPLKLWRLIEEIR